MPRGKGKISGCGSPGLLMKTMEDIDRIREFGNVDDSIGAALVADPDLPNARPYGVHRLPIIGIEPLLNLKKLNAGFTTGVQGKSSQIVTRAAAEFDRLEGSDHGPVYRISHNRRDKGNASDQGGGGGAVRATLSGLATDSEWCRAEHGWRDCVTHRCIEPSMVHGSIQQHVELIAKHEQEFLERRTWAERLGDLIAGAAGSLKFVCAHLVLFAVWIGVNIIPGRPHFDPAPFALLGTLITLEAILLASFILMRQARIGRRADEREHLMLQLLLLTEKEITAVLDLNREIARRVGLGQAADHPMVEELSQHTSIEDVTQTIRESLPGA